MSQKKIEVFDYNHSMGSLMSERLRGLGYASSNHPVDVNTKQEHIEELINESNPDAIILPVNFRQYAVTIKPTDRDMKGMEVVKYLRQQGVNIPIAMFSGSSEYDVKAKEAGANLFFYGAQTNEDLDEIINNLIKEKQQ